MIRFSCPVCGQALKVSEDKADKSIRCPRCHEPTAVRAEASVRSDAAHSAAARHAPAATPAPGLFSGMRPTLRWITTAVAAAGILSLLLVILRPFVFGPEASWAMHGGLLGATCSLVLLFVILYGHATSCPSCGGWWARMKGPIEFVDREVFDRGGASIARSHYRATYTCRHCTRTWSVTETDEYQVQVRTAGMNPAAPGEPPGLSPRSRRRG